MNTLPTENYNNYIYSSGSKKVKFIKNGKTYSRTVKVNNRGTKYVRFDGKDIPLARLKRVN